MSTQSKLIKVKQGVYVYIYVYFKHKGNIIRIPTGNEFIQSFMTKELFYNSKFEGFEEKNKQTKELKRKVDEYLRFRLVVQNDPNINQKECLTVVKGGLESIQRFKTNFQPHIPKSKTVNNYLDDFFEFKKIQLNQRSSYKDYLSFKNSIIDYQKYYKTSLTFEKMNSEDFMVRYRNFLTIEKGTEYKKNGYLTAGGLNDNTINKRISELKTFFSWVQKNRLFNFELDVMDFKHSGYDNTIVPLTKEDIKILRDLKIEKSKENWGKIIDLFVCNCFFGLRISDFMTLKKDDFVVDSDGDYTLIKENKKTGITTETPVNKTALTILEKYDFNLPKFSHQYFNRQLKNILVKYELFPEVITKKRRSNKDVQDKQFLKRELITSHTCRRTFITIGIEKNIPLNVLMNSTGHTKIQTLQKYMKKNTNKEEFKKFDLD